jgi:hypothetical protein
VAQLVKRGCIGALIVAGLACILASSARAAVFNFTNNAANDFPAYALSIGSPSCVELAEAASLSAWRASNQLTAGTSQNQVIYAASCTAEVSPVVGSTVTLNWRAMNGGFASGGTGTWVFTLASITEDSTTQEISGVPVQRVLVLVGSMLAFFLGAILGKS